MGSSSPYLSNESDGDYDRDSEPRPSIAKTPSSFPSPPSKSSQDQEPVRTQKVRKEHVPVRRSVRGTRTKVREELLMSLKRPAVEAYNSMIAGMADDLAPVVKEADRASHDITQNGAVIWTNSEKEIFFRVLSREGKSGIKEIADAIGSKSELEVQEFVRLLHMEMEQQHLTGRYGYAVTLADIPAASEINIKCCKALDTYAELLCLHEQYLADVAGRKKHRDMWIIDKQIAKSLDEEIGMQDNNNEPQDDKASHYSSIYLVAELFDIKNWIRLSQRVFMNSGGPRLADNWSNLAFAGETPSITVDAFADFYALAISITRRLVHSSTFFAMSRIRSMRDRNYEPAKLLKLRDAKAAIDVLGMKCNRFDYWVGLPRRCSLEVSDIRHRKGWVSTYMSYEEVEEILSREELDKPRSEEDNKKRKRRSSRQDISEEQREHGSENDIESSGFSSPPSTPQSPASSFSESEEETPVHREDTYADELDRKASDAEEAQLWRIVNYSASADFGMPAHYEDQKEERERIRAPGGQRKTKQEMVDWRSRTLYRSDWEEYGERASDLYEELSENRRKRLRTQGPDLYLLREPDLDTDTETFSDDTSDERQPEEHAVENYADGEPRGKSDDEVEQTDTDESKCSLYTEFSIDKIDYAAGPQDRHIEQELKDASDRPQHEIHISGRASQQRAKSESQEEYTESECA